MADAPGRKAVALVAVGGAILVAPSTTVARHDGFDSQSVSLLPPCLVWCFVAGVKPAFMVLSAF
jgi:hypothetical protein